MKRNCLAVVHSHWRVGGVRSVLEKTLPAILRETGCDRVVLVGGEAAPRPWLRQLRLQTKPATVSGLVCPHLGYVSELPQLPCAAELRAFWKKLFRELQPAALWWHNPGLGRNVPAVASLLDVAGDGNVPLLFHHHDLWCDHRWQRWEEMRACGYRDVPLVAQHLFSAAPAVTHITINSRDFHLFHSQAGFRVHRLGNPFHPPREVSPGERGKARTWLADQTGSKKGKPVWFAPARLLRRKNLLESLLLRHRFAPEATLVTSNMVPSRDEQPYASALAGVARENRAGFHLLDLNATAAPRMEALIAAADVLVQSSLQEGFGLLFLEAAFAGKPLLCRKLTNVWPDLLERGLHFPLAYKEAMVTLTSEEKNLEAQRQIPLLENWKKTLPADWRHFAPEGLWHPDKNGPVPFSRLTLTGQLNVLRTQMESPQAATMESKSKAGPRVMPAYATQEYARSFAGILAATPAVAGSLSTESPARLQEAIARDALIEENLYPLLLAPQT